MASIGFCEDLWIEILHRLPIQTLCRFRCVCKSWNSLISSSSFISHHFSSSNSNKSDLVFNLYYYNNSWFYALAPPFADFSQLRLPRIPFQPTHNSTRHRSEHLLKVIGVVNGVVCFSHCSKRFTILWNPTIHKYAEIPPLSSSLSGRGRVAYRIGFGFDSRNNDFKVVRIWPPSFPHRPRLQVFSTRQGRWREVALLNDVGEFSFVSDKSCFKDGFIHWVVHRSLGMEILVFDCDREELIKIMDLQPEFQEYNGSFEPSMFLMDAESRAMSYNVKEDGDGKVYFVKDGKRYDECLPIWCRRVAKRSYT